MSTDCRPEDKAFLCLKYGPGRPSGILTSVPHQFSYCPAICSCCQRRGEGLCWPFITEYNRAGERDCVGLLYKSIIGLRRGTVLYTAHTVQKRNLVERKSLIGPWGEGEDGVGSLCTVQEYIL